MSYTGKVVIVTGAGTGIGRAMVQEFVAQGAFVAALGRRADKLQNTLALLPDPSAAMALSVDVSDAEAVDKAVKQIHAQRGRIDLLVNNAGIMDDYTPVHKTDVEGWRKVLDINIVGSYLMCRAVIPHMLDQGKGVIINVASVTGSKAGGGGSAYTTSKHGLIGFTRALTFEYGTKGIRVNSLSPGATATPMNFPEDRSEDFPDVEAAVRDLPAGRFCQPEEIAKLASFLGSDACDYVHGSDYVMDGGWLTAGHDQF